MATMKPLILVGYMGCGKSTLGRKLARRLGIPYADTDALVEEREGASVSDVFRYEGEQRFREVEREVLARVIGEGAEQIARRLSPYGRRKRPRLQGLNDEELVAFMERDMAAREPFYAQASLIVDCDLLSDEEVVECILARLKDGL